MLFKVVSVVLTGLVLLNSCGGTNSKVWEDYAKAKVLYSQGRIDEAVKNLATLVNKSANFAPAKLLYGRALYFHKDYQKANEVLTSLQASHPESVEASLWLVRTLVQQGRLSDAESLLTGLLTTNPDDSRLAYQMALLRENHNDLPGARDFLTSAENADEDLALVHYEAARVSFQLHDTERTRAELSKALGFLSPTSLLRKPIERLQSDLQPSGSLNRSRP